MRLDHWDFPDLMRPLPPLASQVLFGALCSVVAIGLRMLTDIWLPGAGPFALTIPIVLVATLFGRWVAGLVCQTVVSVYAWYFVLPIVGSFDFADPGDGPRVFVNLVSGYFVVALAELFRRTVRQALKDREALLLELEHRVKNSFASIASVLQLQMRNTTSKPTRAALQAALGRVQSYARAYSFLYYRHDRGDEINMRTYLKDLCTALEATADPDSKINFRCDATEAYLFRDRAIVIGLLVNELSTNSFKHAFGNDGGEISVNFKEMADAYHLVVADNGRGIGERKPSGSLGLKLIDVLASQAKGTMVVETGTNGTVYSFSFAR